jgi:hypothetical protein
MADYAISNVPRRVVYAASGTGPYAFTFEILNQTDIAVYKASTLLTLTTDYTVTINANGTGSVTLVTSAGTSNITIVGAKNIQRTTDFTTGGDLFANTLNDELDNQTIFIQQVAETAERGLKAPVVDPTDINMTLPAKASRVGTVLAFNATTGNPEAGPSIGSVTTVAAQSANINTVATNIGSVNTVAGNTSNINTVAGVSSNVTTVAGSIANVNTVADDLNEGVSEINTVAVDIANVNTVGTNIASVNTVAGEIGAGQDVTVVAANLSGTNTIGTVATNIANVNATGTNIANVNAVGSDLLEAVSEINTVATDITNVNTVGTNIGSVNTVAGISSNVSTVAGISANVTTVAGINSAVSTVASNNANVTTVATNIASVNTCATDIAQIITTANDLNEAVSEIEVCANNIANINTVGTNISNVNTVAGISANVTTVATNVADINNYADTYQGAKATDPTLRNDGSALQSGDLYFNTTDDVMKVREAGAWLAAYASLSGALIAANNLSDVTSTSTARTNLGLGTGNTPTFTGVITGAGTVSAPAITTTGDTNTGIFFPAADTIAFTEGGVEAMRIDSSANVGIGTNSPGCKLDVYNSASAAANNEILRLRWVTSTTAGHSGDLNFTNQSGTPLGRISNVIQDGSNVALAFSTYSSSLAERMRISSTGELGLGANGYSSTNRLALAYDGGSGVATVGPNSTGGSTILTFGTSNAGTYGERMRIDGAGNLQLGGTTAYGKATIGTGAGGGNYPAASTTDLAFGASSNRNILFLSDSGSTGTDGAIGAWNTVYNFQNSRIVFDKNAANTGQLLFQTNAGSGITERMRIDSSGNVGVNNTSPAVIASTVQVAVKANVNGNSLFVAQNSNGLTTAKFGFQFTGGIDQPIVGTETAHPLVFVTNNTERLRIPSDAAGIQFPATQVASSNANTLDDYEEGTWTITVTTGTSGSVTASAKTGAYTKVGRLVTITGYIDFSSVSSPVGYLRLSLPFTSGSGVSFESAASFMFNSIVSANVADFIGTVNNNAATLDIYLGNGSIVSSTSANQVQASTSIRFQASYMTA